MKITFEEVRMYGRKNVKCDGCGRRLKRQHRFEQTINPFNKKADGTIKNQGDIYNELREEIRAWEKEPETCPRCEERSRVVGKKCPKCGEGKIIEVESPDDPNPTYICDHCVFEFYTDEERRLIA